MRFIAEQREWFLPEMSPLKPGNQTHRDIVTLQHIEFKLFIKSGQMWDFSFFLSFLNLVCYSFTYLLKFFIENM